MPVSTTATSSRPKCLAAEANRRSTEGAYLSPLSGDAMRVCTCEPARLELQVPASGSDQDRSGRQLLATLRLAGLERR